jgi:hypothetical protein
MKTGDCCNQDEFHYADGTEVEFGITVRSWACTNEVDRGTQQQVSRGMRILYDGEAILQSLLTKVQRTATSF